MTFDSKTGEAFLESSEEWLELFRQKIDEGYEGHRMDRVLAGDLKQVDKPTREMQECGLEYNLKDLAYDPTGQHVTERTMIELGENLAEREYCWIVRRLIEHAEEVENTINAETKSRLTKKDLKKATAIIGKLNLIVDRLVIPKIVCLKFRQGKQLLEPNRILTGYLPEEQRGHYFCGMFGVFKIYSAEFLTEEAVLFVRDKITVRNTPHKVNFDNMNKPKKLIMEKWCYSEIRDDAVIEIKL